MACGQNVWRPEKTETNQNPATLWSPGEHELTPSVDQTLINVGQHFTITDTVEDQIPANAIVTLRFKARLHTDKFSAGSYAFLQVNLNDTPLTAEHLRQEDACYHYPQCNWGEGCAEQCHEWMLDNFSSHLTCEGEDFDSPEPRRHILALQISSNFENHLVTDNPNHEGINDNGFYIDPAVSGDPYQFEFDLSSQLQGFSGEFNLAFNNPMTDYAAYMRCVVRRDYDFWGTDSIQFVRVVLADIQLVIDVPEPTTP